MIWGDTQAGRTQPADARAPTKLLQEPFGCNQRDHYRSADAGAVQSTSVQYRGYDAFNDPLVQERLALTPDQRQKLTQYNQEWHKSMGDLNRDYGTDREGVTKRFGEMRQREQERMGKIFTAQQQKTWSQMTGAPYSFSPTSTSRRRPRSPANNKGQLRPACARAVPGV